MIKNYHNQKLRHSILTKNIDIDVQSLVIKSLKEDLGNNIDPLNDITTKLVSNNIAKANIVTRNHGIFCGKKWVDRTISIMNNKTNINWLVSDGDIIECNQILCTLVGPINIILTVERTILNFIQTLSGVATTVHYYINKLAGTNAMLLDTRKTVPGMRTALKYATLCGGGYNHRLGLNDAILIKDNHIKASGSISKILRKAFLIYPNMPIGIEVKSLSELKTVLDIGVDLILLDNFSLDNIVKAVKITSKQVLLEASGNINKDNIRSIAESGVDYISVGNLTKNICALDIAMNIL